MPQAKTRDCLLIESGLPAISTLPMLQSIISSSDFPSPKLPTTSNTFTDNQINFKSSKWSRQVRHTSLCIFQGPSPHILELGVNSGVLSMFCDIRKQQSATWMATKAQLAKHLLWPVRQVASALATVVFGSMLTRASSIVVATVRGDSKITGTVTFEQATESSPTTITWDITGNDANAERGMHIHQFGDNTNGCTSAGPHCKHTR